MKKGLLIFGLILLDVFGAWAEALPSLPRENPAKKIYFARLESTELTGDVGHATLVKIQLEPQTVPFGHYIVSLAEVVAGPPGPQAEILTGYPVIRITPRAAGEYQIEVRVNLIIKTSCGGAEATPLLKQGVHLVVEPATD